MEKWNIFSGYEHKMDFIKKVVLELNLMPKDIFFSSGYSFSHFRKQQEHTGCGIMYRISRKFMEPLRLRCEELFISNVEPRR